MDRPYFEETQYLRQTRWVWYIIIPTVLLACIPLYFWITDQPVKNSDASSSELLLASILTLVCMVVSMLILLSIKLDMRIDQTGIHYRFFPNKPRWSSIRKEDIAEMEVRTKKNFFTQGITGYHRNVFQKTRSMSISGSNHLWIRMHNNQKILLGTQNPNELERAIKRLLSTEIKY